MSACDEEVVVEVINDGTAVSEDEACFMFDRFATGRGGKTGIGLALAAEYARIHGGSIEAYPLAAGTRVAVTFPSAAVAVLG